MKQKNGYFTCYTQLLCLPHQGNIKDRKCWQENLDLTAEWPPQQPYFTYIFHTHINWTNHIKYLGVTSDSQLSNTYVTALSKTVPNFCVAAAFVNWWSCNQRRDLRGSRLHVWPFLLHLAQYRISNALCKANHRLGQLYPVIDKSSPININLALAVYISLIRPTLTYAAPAWEHAAKIHFNTLQCTLYFSEQGVKKIIANSQGLHQFRLH